MAGNGVSLLDEARVYFLARSAVENSADPSDALVVLLSGPLSLHHGQAFNPATLSQTVYATYGWTISSHAIEFLIEKFRKRGWLESRSDFPSRGPFFVNLPDVGGDEDHNILDSINLIGREFLSFSANVSPINALPTDPANAASLLLRYAVRANANSNGDIPANDIDYLSGRFIEKINEESSDLSSLLSSLSSLGFLSVVADDLSNPKSNRKVDLKVIVDGPIILDYLKCSGDLRSKASNELFDDLRSMGATIVTFTHCVAEAKSALATVLKTDARDRYGPTGDALRRGLVKEAALEGMLPTFDVVVKKAGIEILPDHVDFMPSSHQYFNEDRLSALEQIVNWHDQSNNAAREADADTTALTIRRRAFHKTSGIFDSKFVAVTTNASFAGATRRFLKDTNYYNETQTPPVITLRELSATRLSP